jgi:putative transcriptional regulator
MSQQPPVNDSLKGSLILADPTLREPTFYQSVLLLTEHSPEFGALGYMLNRPFGHTIGEVMSTKDLSDEQRTLLGDVPIFVGGPVDPQRLSLSAFSWFEEDAELHYVFHLTTAEAARYCREGFHIRAFLGYSGWSEGQLEGEMKQRAWISHRPEREIMEVKHADELWRNILRDLSPWHRLVADEPDHLGLN